MVWSIDLQVNEIRATEKGFLSFKHKEQLCPEWIVRMKSLQVHVRKGVNYK